MSFNRRRLAFRPGLVALTWICFAAGLTSACDPPEPPPAPASGGETLASERPPSAAMEAFEAIDLPNQRSPLKEMVSGGQPDEASLEAAARAGFRTVVNLRRADEPVPFNEEAKVEELGLRYISIPVAGAAGLTAENVQRFAEVVDNPGLYPMVVHCASGNRVGALFALKVHQVDGVGPDSALIVGKEAGLTRLEPAVRELLGIGASEPAGSD